MVHGGNNIFFWTVAITSTSLHGGHYIKDDKWCLNGGRYVYMRDHEGGGFILFLLLFIFFSFGIPNVSRGGPHCDTAPSQANRVSNIGSQIAKNENYVHGGDKISIISFVD